MVVIVHVSRNHVKLHMDGPVSINSALWWQVKFPQSPSIENIPADMASDRVYCMEHEDYIESSSYLDAVGYVQCSSCKCVICADCIDDSHQSGIPVFFGNSEDEAPLRCMYCSGYKHERSKITEDDVYTFVLRKLGLRSKLELNNACWRDLSGHLRVNDRQNMAKILMKRKIRKVNLFDHESKVVSMPTQLSVIHDKSCFDDCVNQDVKQDEQ